RRRIAARPQQPRSTRWPARNRDVRSAGRAVRHRSFGVHSIHNASDDEPSPVLSTIDTIRRRRAALTSRLSPRDNFTALEESCVPSYCHPNVAAAAVAWWRLAKTAALCRRYSPPGAILDFGAATGEIAHLIGGD